MRRGRSGKIGRVTWLPSIFSLLVGAAGWYYLFFGRSVARLAEVEGERRNRLRRRLRRIGGFSMLLLGAAFYVTIRSADLEPPRPWGVILGGSAVVVLLVVVLVLALADLRLTRRTRREVRERMREDFKEARRRGEGTGSGDGGD